MSKHIPEQLQRADEAVCNLMRAGLLLDTEHLLAQEQFPLAVQLQRDIVAGYEAAAFGAQQALAALHQQLGLTAEPPAVSLSPRKEGDITILTALPFATLLRHAPTEAQACRNICSSQIVATSFLRQMSDDEVRAQAQAIGDTVLGELAHLREADAQVSDRTIVVLQTTKWCNTPDANGDLVHGRVATWQKYPHLVGYLLYEYLVQNAGKVAFARANNTFLCSTWTHGHVRLSVTRGGGVDIWHDTRSGYKMNIRLVVLV